MLKVAVMGDYDSIYGFQALGLEIFNLFSSSIAMKRSRICGIPK